MVSTMSEETISLGISLFLRRQDEHTYSRSSPVQLEADFRSSSLGGWRVAGRRAARRGAAGRGGVRRWRASPHAVARWHVSQGMHVTQLALLHAKEVGIRQSADAE